VRACGDAGGLSGAPRRPRLAVLRLPLRTSPFTTRAWPSARGSVRRRRRRRRGDAYASRCDSRLAPLANDLVIPAPRHLRLLPPRGTACTFICATCSYPHGTAFRPAHLPSAATVAAAYASGRVNGTGTCARRQRPRLACPAGVDRRCGALQRYTSCGQRSNRH
jgi:hypothetical protein